MSDVAEHAGAARAGVENLTRSLSVEWASSGLRVNCLSPGIIFSPTARANYDFEVFEEAKPNIPAKRLGTTQEVWWMDGISRMELQHFHAVIFLFLGFLLSLFLSLSRSKFYQVKYCQYKYNISSLIDI